MSAKHNIGKRVMKMEVGSIHSTGHVPQPSAVSCIMMHRSAADIFRFGEVRRAAVMSAAGYD